MKTLFKLVIIAISSVLAFLAVSCDNQEDLVPTPNEGNNMVEETVVNQQENNSVSSTSPVQLPETRLSLSGDQMKNISPGNDFTFRYFKKVYDNPTFKSPTTTVTYDVDNIILSPLSIQFVCGMLGNYIEDSEALCKMLGIEGKSIDGVNDYYKSLINDLVKEGSGTKLSLANALMTDVNSLRFPSEFIKAINDFYQADYLDFEAKSLDEQPIGERPEDLWVQEKTEGLIDAAPFPIMKEDYSLFNTICFKGEWKNKFEASDTKQMPFYVNQNVTGNVPFMFKTFVYPYYQNQFFRSVSIPMGDGSYYYTVLLPNDNISVETVLEELSSKTWDQLRSSLENKYIQVGIPKFTANFQHHELFGLLDEDFRLDFISQIEKKQEKDFDNTAIFNRLSQRAIFKVDEDGAAAAAVSQLGRYTSTGKDNPIPTFVANKPFVYLISEAGSGLVLFMGTYSGKNT